MTVPRRALVSFGLGAVLVLASVTYGLATPDDPPPCITPQADGTAAEVCADVRDGR